MLSGLVIHGDKIGRTLGFPTANLDIAKKHCPFAPGVYAVKVKLNKKEYQGALAIQEKPRKVEVHLLNYFGEDFYGKYLEVELVQKVSEMENMDSLEELKEKIQKDMEMVREIFMSS